MSLHLLKGEISVHHIDIPYNKLNNQIQRAEEHYDGNASTITSNHQSTYKRMQKLVKHLRKCYRKSSPEEPTQK